MVPGLLWHRVVRRSEFSWLSFGTTGHIESISGDKIHPTPSPLALIQRTDICIRSLHGEYFSAPSLDRALGRAYLGHDLATHAQSVHHHRRPCGRSHRHVQGRADSRCRSRSGLSSEEKCDE